MSPTRTFKAPFQLSPEASEATFAAFQAINITVRGLTSVKVPLLAILLAAADATVEAGTALLDEAAKADAMHRQQAVDALRLVAKMMGEFFEEAIGERPGLFPGDVDGAMGGPTSGTVN